MLPVLYNTHVEGFSISEAVLLDPDTGLPLEDGLLYGVKSGEITPEIDSWDDVSNDTYVDAWSEVKYLNVSISMSHLPVRALSLMTGSELDIPDITQYQMELFERSWGGQSFHPMKITIPARDADGNNRVLYYLLYRVKFYDFDFMEASYKEGLPINFQGKAFISSVDEAGAALSQPSFGRLISIDSEYV